MTTIQMALREAMPRQMAELCRRERHARAVAKGRRLMLDISRCVIQDKPVEALATIRKDREVIACFLASANNLPVMTHKGQAGRSGFSEVKLMEEFFHKKIREVAVD